MIDEFCFSNEGNIPISTSLKRKFTRKINQIPRNSEINFICPDIERRTFNQVHKYVIRLYFQADKTLNNIGIIDDGQFENLSLRQFNLSLPVEIPAVLFSNIFQRNFSLKAISRLNIFNRVCQFIYNKFKPCLPLLFHTIKIQEMCLTNSHSLSL